MQPVRENLNLNLSTHLKTHNGEKSNKCNQCDFAYSLTGDLRTHLKQNIGQTENKCNQVDFASSWAGNLITHSITNIRAKSNQCNLLAGKQLHVVMCLWCEHAFSTPFHESKDGFTCLPKISAHIKLQLYCLPASVFYDQHSSLS